MSNGHYIQCIAALSFNLVVNNKMS